MNLRYLQPLHDGRTAQSWMDELTLQHDWNRRHAMSLLAVLGIPRKMLDVGCGDGTFVSVAVNMGVDAIGVDQIVDNQWESNFFRYANLVDRFVMDPPKQMNMVLCLEVAEHLDQSAHPTLCDTLAMNLAEGGGNYLVFSSAHPGQGGNGHISERPASYWQKEFFLRQMNYRDDLTCRLQLAWLNLRSPLWWLPANVMVFEK